MKIFNDTDPDNIEDLTEEIIAEADEHQVFYAITDELIEIQAYPSASNDSNDSDGNPFLLKRPGRQQEKLLVMLGYLIHEPISPKQALLEMILVVQPTLKKSISMLKNVE